MRLIDADSLMEYFGMSDDCQGCVHDWKDCRYSNEYCLMDFCSAVDEIPTIQATNAETSVKHGKWYHAWANDHFDVTDWECSECDGIIHNTERTNFCPHCGADMREVEK